MHQAATDRTPDVPEPCAMSRLADQAPKLAGGTPEPAPPKPTAPADGSMASRTTRMSPTAQVREGYVMPSDVPDVLVPPATPNTKTGEVMARSRRRRRRRRPGRYPGWTR